MEREVKIPSSYLNHEKTVRIAQLYGFLAYAYVYPEEVWVEDIEAVRQLLKELGVKTEPYRADWTLEELQADHRRAFGLTGSLCYEAEYGEANEFQMSQRLADIVGFYRAFGVQTGGQIRERPDHVAAELEFLYLLSLKQARAIQADEVENAIICADAHARFLVEHPGRWLDLFAKIVKGPAPDSPYSWIAGTTSKLIQADARALGVELAPLVGGEVKPTPEGAEFSCQACPIPSREWDGASFIR